MTKYVQVSKAHAYKINFVVDGEPVTPSSAKFTLTRNDGTVMGGFDETALTIAAGATSYTVAIPGSANAATLDSELRYCVTEFTYNSRTYILRDFYFLRDTLNFPLTEEQVRAALGLSSTELPDESIDIIRAYEQVQLDVPDTDLSNILEGGTELLPVLVEAVTYKAALQSASVMQSSMLQMEQADNTLYRRFEEIDFDGIFKRLEKAYSLAVLRLTGATATSEVTLAIVTADTDNITGV